MMESCELCSQLLHDSDGSRKYRKLLYGNNNSCSKELSILNSLIFTIIGFIVWEVLWRDAYLWAPCR